MFVFYNYFLYRLFSLVCRLNGVLDLFQVIFFETNFGHEQETVPLSRLGGVSSPA